MRIGLLIISMLLVLNGFSQTDTIKVKKKQFPSISTIYQYGNIIPTTDFVKGDNLMGKPLKHYQSFSLKVLWQNPGYTDWQKVYHGPYYGGGLTVGDFFNPEEVGYPISLYGVLGIPIIRWKKLEIYSEFQFGIAWNWEHYDSITNPKNLVIGGGLTVHLSLGINAFYHVSRNLDIGVGFSFIHFSNGGFERPNKGFNIYAPSVELKYHIAKRPDVMNIEPAGRIERSNDLFFMLGYGDHQLNEHELDTNYYAIGGLSIIYFTQLSNAFRLGYGSDFNYWWGLNALPDGTPGPRTIENLTIGFILQPELVIDNLTLVAGFGIYAKHLIYGNFKQTYQRLGVRYEFYKNLSFGVNVRAVNFMLAEFLEFNLGYRIRWMK